MALSFMLLMLNIRALFSHPPGFLRAVLLSKDNWLQVEWEKIVFTFEICTCKLIWTLAELLGSFVLPLQDLNTWLWAAWFRPLGVTLTARRHTAGNKRALSFLSSLASWYVLLSETGEGLDWRQGCSLKDRWQHQHHKLACCCLRGDKVRVRPEDDLQCWW